jgi:sugar phosphate permease
MHGEKMNSAVQPASLPDSPAQPDPVFETAVYRKVTWRLIPFLFMCYIFAYLDRVNVGFAKLQMQRDLHMSDAVYGFGAGIFFLGYLLFQVPCNMALQKIGAKYWLGPIMIVWGFVSACTMFATGGYGFYALRFLLGVVESGFFPGVILYLTFWYPSKYRAKMVAAFMTAIPISGLVGGPISGWLLNTMASVGGLRAWQWLFIVEAVPSVVAGFLTMVYLQDSPARAKWLSIAERALLMRRLGEDESARKNALEDHHHSFRAALSGRNVWLFCLMYFGTVMGNYGLQFWLPQIIKDTLTKDSFHIGLYTMIPWGVTAVVMVLVGHHSDKTGERAWHLALSAAAGGLGLALSAIPGISGGFGLFALTIATAGIISASANFWSLPTMYLSGAAASGGIALINSIGNLGGQAGPYLIGQINQLTHSMTPALFTLACGCWCSALLTLIFFRKQRSPSHA